MRIPLLTVDEQYELLKRQHDGTITPREIVTLLRDRYTPEPVPPCSVCGGPLTVQGIMHGVVTWACSGQEDDPERPGWLRRKAGRTLADEHYSRSRFEQRQIGDRLVLALCDRYEALSRERA